MVYICLQQLYLYHIYIGLMAYFIIHLKSYGRNGNHIITTFSRNRSIDMVHHLLVSFCRFLDSFNLQMSRRILPKSFANIESEPSKRIIINPLWSILISFITKLQCPFPTLLQLPLRRRLPISRLFTNMIYLSCHGACCHLSSVYYNTIVICGAALATQFFFFFGFFFRPLRPSRKTNFPPIYSIFCYFSPVCSWINLFNIFNIFPHTIFPSQAWSTQLATQ